MLTITTEGYEVIHGLLTFTRRYEDFDCSMAEAIADRDPFQHRLLTHVSDVFCVLWPLTCGAAD